MLIHDDIFSWEGFGGLFQLAAGSCRLRVFDLARGESGKVTPLKSKGVVVSDLPDDSPKVKKVSVRSCCSHIATCVVEQFSIDPNRMIFVEYYPGSTYGDQNQHTIAPKYEKVEFEWHGTKALHPRWRPLDARVLAVVAPEMDRLEKGSGSSPRQS
ncbi:MAG: hypothetical protein P8X55_10005 [Desulfosarcinaceae bacterium]